MNGLGTHEKHDFKSTWTTIARVNQTFSGLLVFFNPPWSFSTSVTPTSMKKGLMQNNSCLFDWSNFRVFMSHQTVVYMYCLQTGMVNEKFD